MHEQGQMLYLASLWGHEETMVLLLDAGATVPDNPLVASQIFTTLLIGTLQPRDKPWTLSRATTERLISMFATWATLDHRQQGEVMMRKEWVQRRIANAPPEVPEWMREAWRRVEARM